MPVALATESDTKTISNLEAIISGLPEKEKKLARKIYHVRPDVGYQELPPEMVAWATNQFKAPLEVIEKQTILRVTNNFTRDEALFNELRASRPIEPESCSTGILEEIRGTKGCSFCDPERMTPTDIAGRIKGEHSLTASNVAKYDARHGLIIPFVHNTMQTSVEMLRDYLDVAKKWFWIQRDSDSDASCPWLMWNALWRAGGSIKHGHMQLTMSTGGHYPGVERLKAAGDRYSQDGSNGLNLFNDLYVVHEALGLGIKVWDAMVIAELTPKKEKGIMVIQWGEWDEFRRLAEPVNFVFSKYMEMGVQSFNASFYLPALPRDNGWHRMPFIVRFNDRGPLESKVSDIGGMELHAEIPVISTDPYKLMRELVKNN